MQNKHYLSKRHSFKILRADLKKPKKMDYLRIKIATKQLKYTFASSMMLFKIFCIKMDTLTVKSYIFISHITEINLCFN